MKVTGLFLVRNEVDLIELNLRHHLATVLDDAIVVDNGSTDGSLELLCELARELPLTVASEPGGYMQSELVSRMAQHATRTGSDWVLAVDADEFWVAAGRDFREILAATPPEVGQLMAEVTNFVQGRDELAPTTKSLLGATMRATPKPPRDECPDRVESGEIAFVEIVYPPKCVSRTAPGMLVMEGNHEVRGVPGEVRDEPAIECLHIPLRARSMLTTKIDQGRRVEDTGIDLSLRRYWHVRRWWHLAREGRIGEEWQANSHAGGALTLQGGPRPLDEDDRLREIAAAHPATVTDVPVHPLHRLDPAVGAYLLALDTVPGWFSELDFRLFEAIDSIQRAHGLRGDALEIGAYCGKSAILLGYLVGRDDGLLVCDLFNQNEETTAENREENERWYPGFGRADFESHYLHFHAELPELFVGPSTDIDRDGLAGRFRMVHLDGSHVHEIVREDIHTAQRLLAPGGVVMLDDLSTPHNPGSALGIWEAVVEQRITPLCITNAKMYALFDAGAIDWEGELARWLGSQDDIRVEMHKLAGRQVPRLVPAERVVGTVPPDALAALAPLEAASSDPQAPPPPPQGPPTLRDRARAIAPPITLRLYRKLKASVRRRGEPVP